MSLLEQPIATPRVRESPFNQPRINVAVGFLPACRTPFIHHHGAIDSHPGSTCRSRSASARPSTDAESRRAAHSGYRLFGERRASSRVPGEIRPGSASSCGANEIARPRPTNRQQRISADDEPPNPSPLTTPVPQTHPRPRPSAPPRTHSSTTPQLPRPSPYEPTSSHAAYVPKSPTP